jgi:hypothetical protein
LSWAIDQVDADPSAQADTINFSFQGPGPFTISPTGDLPALTHPVDIVGGSSSNLDGARLVVIDGSFASAGSDGLSLALGSDGSTITGLCVSGFGSGAGIYIASDHNLIENNYLGTNNTGSSSVSALDGNQYGIFLNRAGQNTIGGTAGANAANGNAILSNGNLISGNSTGIELHASSTNLIEGNFIGTDISGLSAVPNDTGVTMDSMSSGNTIGGATAVSLDQKTTILMGNVISGNLNFGVQIENGGTRANVVEGNFIGVDASGGKALANDFGVLIETAATGNTIGGTSASFRNIISGNQRSGVYIDGPGTNQNTVEGNDIGTDPSGTVSLPNANGVLIDGGARSNTIGAANVVNANGSIRVLKGNIISGNLNDGVHIQGIGGTAAPNNTSENVLQGNLIGVNSNLLVDDTGTLGLINSLSNQVGVLIDDGATSNTIGAGNVIGCNFIAGVEISGYQTTLTPGPVPPPFNTTNNAIVSSFIGTDPTGLLSLGNESGVLIDDGATMNTVGGSRNEGNVISSNLGPGVDIRGSNAVQTSDNTVAGNFIGTDATGELAYNPTLQNLLSNPIGILLEAGASYNTIGGIDAIVAGKTELTQGNLISNNSVAGVEISGSGSTQPTEYNVVEGNFIGTDALGVSTLFTVPFPMPLGNGTGVLIVAGEGAAPDNTVGGTAPGARNVISGNRDSGVEISGGKYIPYTGGNVVEGNYIGTDVTGRLIRHPYETGSFPIGILDSYPLGNAIGVSIDSGALFDSVGGTSAAARNVISGNIASGVDINGATSNQVQDNLIGTDFTGTVPLPNGVGVTIEGESSSNTIGGLTLDPSNVISGNTGAGVAITGASASFNTVEGNYIGTAANGLSPMANATGVLITAGASSTTVGGSSQPPRNVISGNTGAGVEILGFQSSSGAGSSGQQGVDTINANSIAGNYIGTDSTGTMAVPNSVGVLLSNSPDNLIGSPAFFDDDYLGPNVISGNSSVGVEILGPASTNNELAGNVIGPDVTGKHALRGKGLSGSPAAVQQTGILIDGSTGNSIGAKGAPFNVISGNSVGIEFTNINATSSNGVTNTVEYNYIGIGKNQKALGNVTGILVNDVPGTQIGLAGAGNTIAGNSEAGVYIIGSDATGNLVQGNDIGLGPRGQTYNPLLQTHFRISSTNPFPIGVYIQDSSKNTIGGTAARAGNTISGNNVGVYIFGTGGSSTNNQVIGNLIGLSVSGGSGRGNLLYGVIFVNAPDNSAPQSGRSANRITSSGIANFREYSGPVAKTSHASPGSGSSSKNNRVHHSNHLANQLQRRLAHHA